MTKKTTTKKRKGKEPVNLKKATRAIKKIEGTDFQIWFVITLIYVVFVAILSGMVKAWLPELLYFGKLPIDPQYGVFALMIALWIPISLLLKALLKK